MYVCCLSQHKILVNTNDNVTCMYVCCLSQHKILVNTVTFPNTYIAQLPYLNSQIAIRYSIIDNKILQKYKKSVRYMLDF